MKKILSRIPIETTKQDIFPFDGEMKTKRREEKLNSFGLESHIFKCLKSTDILHFNQTKRDIYKTVTNYLNQTNQNGTYLTNKCW